MAPFDTNALLFAPIEVETEIKNTLNKTMRVLVLWTSCLIAKLKLN